MFEIIRYRDERDPFDAVRQLDEVPGQVRKWDSDEAHVRIG